MQLKLTLFSYDFKYLRQISLLLNDYLKVILHYFFGNVLFFNLNILDYFSSSIIFYQVHRDVVSVIRSSHVFSKSHEHFERRLFKVNIIFNFFFDLSDIFIFNISTLLLLFSNFLSGRCYFFLTFFLFKKIFLYSLLFLNCKTINIR